MIGQHCASATVGSLSWPMRRVAIAQLLPNFGRCVAPPSPTTAPRCWRHHSTLTRHVSLRRTAWKCAHEPKSLRNRVSLRGFQRDLVTPPRRISLWHSRGLPILQNPKFLDFWNSGRLRHIWKAARMIGSLAFPKTGLAATPFSSAGVPRRAAGTGNQAANHTMARPRRKRDAHQATTTS